MTALAADERGKAALRDALRLRRSEFVADAGARLHAVVEDVARRIDAACATAACIAGYVALPDEIDALPALRRAHARGQATALPRVISRTQPMRLLAWTPGAPLEKGYFGLQQPSAAAARATPDVVLVPLLGFDRSRARLGQGAGFYDRYLAQHPAAFRLGVAWSVQEVDALPVDPWDAPLHAIVTEREWIGATFGEASG